MSNAQFPELEKHRNFFISRIFLVQLVALCIIAVVMGVLGININKQFVYDDISSTSSSVKEFIENYCESKTSKSSKISEKILEANELVQDVIDIAAEQSNTSILLFDENGKCLISSKNTDTDALNTSLSLSAIKSIRKNGEIISNVQNTLNIGNSKPAISNGSQFYITNPDGTKTEYFLLINDYSDQVEIHVRTTIAVGVIIVIIMLILFAVFLRRFIKKYLVDPEVNFSRIIRQYAKGDYSEILDPEKFSTLYYKENMVSINQIISNLKATNEQQTQFISNVSHELRTPMTIISGYVNGILDGTVPKSKQTEYLYIISQEMQRLKILISSMLNLTKYENGTIKIKCEIFPINDLIFKTFLMFESRIEKRNITIEGLDCDTMYVYGDNDLISQVVYNLVENAVKFVDTGGTISIRLEDKKDESVFNIRNTGPGIPKDELPKIFGRFYKSDFSRSQDKTGLGLGLDIIRKILILHNAQISVSSEENVFTEFSVCFPKKFDTQD